MSCTSFANEKHYHVECKDIEYLLYVDFNTDIRKIDSIASSYSDYAIIITWACCIAFYM